MYVVTACSCDGNGSISPVCDNITGQCICQLGNAGRTCIDCEVCNSVSELILVYSIKLANCLKNNWQNDKNFSTSRW